MEQIVTENGVEVLRIVDTSTRKLQKEEIKNRIADWENEVASRKAMLDQAKEILADWRAKLLLFKQ